MGSGSCALHGEFAALSEAASRVGRCGGVTHPSGGLLGWCKVLFLRGFGLWKKMWKVKSPDSFESPPISAYSEARGGEML